MFHRYYDNTLLSYCWAEQLEEVRESGSRFRP